MKRVKSYNRFREDRPIKEEFISKLWRNITGENKRRIEELVSVLDIEARKDKLNQLASSLPSFINKEDMLSRFNQDWEKNLEYKLSQNLNDDIQNLLRNIYRFDISKIKEILSEKISELDGSEWILLSSQLSGLELYTTDDIFSNVKNQILKDFRKELKNYIENFDANFKSQILRIFEDESIIYWGDYLCSNKCDPEYIKENPEYSGIQYLPQFVKSLCLRLDNQFFNINNYSDYAFSYDSNKYSYINQFGIEYKNRFTPLLDKKVIDLPEFKQIEREVNSIRDILNDRNDKKNKQNKKVDEFIEVSGGEKKVDFIWELKIDDKEDNIKLKKELVNNDDDHRVTYLNPRYIVRGFDWIKSTLADKKVSEIIKELKSNRNIITVEKSDSKMTRYVNDNGEKLCGNVYYFGTIHPDITIKNISDYVNKKGGSFIINPGTGAIALYCTAYPSAAAQYAYLRTSQTINYKTLDRYCPSVYKIVLKEGSKFVEGSDTSINREEKERLTKLGYVGVHSANQEVSGGSTTEVSIVIPECIESVEKIPLSELSKITDNEWKEGSKSDREQTLTQLDEWEKIHLKTLQ